LNVGDLLYYLIVGMRPWYSNLFALLYFSRDREHLLFYSTYGVYDL
jgi:hypothetical protein